MPRSSPKLAPGQTMAYWLAQAARAVRDRAGKRLKDVSEITGVPVSTISRFEEGTAWPRQVDALIAGYARLGGLRDARDLWALAIRLWYEHGQPPNEGDIADHIAALVAREIEQLPRTG